MADWILDRIEDSGEIDGVHVVTNAVYAPAFERWAAGRGVVVHDDGTTSNETRLGALGDIRLAVREGGLGADGLLVIAADNLFEFSLADYIAFWRAKGEGSAIAVHRLADPTLASLYGVVELDDDDRIVIGMEEKPERPRSDLARDCDLPLLRRAPGAARALPRRGQPPDPPGRFLSWLCRARRVYGFRFNESVARHRESRAAARGRQPLPGGRRPPAAGRRTRL